MSSKSRSRSKVRSKSVKKYRSKSRSSRKSKKGGGKCCKSTKQLQLDSKQGIQPPAPGRGIKTLEPLPALQQGHRGDQQSGRRTGSESNPVTSVAVADRKDKLDVNPVSTRPNTIKVKESQLKATVGPIQTR